MFNLQVLEGWFIDTPIEKIHRENMASWCSWAFFDSDLTDLTAAERAENEQILSYIEHGAKWKFPPGTLRSHTSLVKYSLYLIGFVESRWLAAHLYDTC